MVAQYLFLTGSFALLVVLNDLAVIHSLGNLDYMRACDAAPPWILVETRPAQPDAAFRTSGTRMTITLEPSLASVRDSSTIAGIAASYNTWSARRSGSTDGTNRPR